MAWPPEIRITTSLSPNREGMRDYWRKQIEYFTRYAEMCPYEKLRQSALARVQRAERKLAELRRPDPYDINKNINRRQDATS